MTIAVVLVTGVDEDGGDVTGFVPLVSPSILLVTRRRLVDKVVDGWGGGGGGWSEVLVVWLMIG